MTTVAGPAFPFAIDPQTGGVATVQGERKLGDNIRLILGTRIGERPMLRQFGSPLRSLVQEPNDGALGRLVTRYAKETLMTMEPRVRVLDARFESIGGEATLRLRYAPSDRPEPQLLLIPLS